MFSFFFFNDTATTEIYTLSLHDALPIWPPATSVVDQTTFFMASAGSTQGPPAALQPGDVATANSSPSSRRSEEHTSELQSRQYIVCRLLLEKKKSNLLLEKV